MWCNASAHVTLPPIACTGHAFFPPRPESFLNFLKTPLSVPHSHCEHRKHNLLPDCLLALACYKPNTKWLLESYVMKESIILLDVQAAQKYSQAIRIYSPPRPLIYLLLVISSFYKFIFHVHDSRVVMDALLHLYAPQYISSLKYNFKLNLNLMINWNTSWAMISVNVYGLTMAIIEWDIDQHRMTQQFDYSVFIAGSHYASSEISGINKANCSPCTVY